MRTYMITMTVVALVDEEKFSRIDSQGSFAGFVGKDGNIYRPIIGFEQQSGSVEDPVYRDITSEDQLDKCGINLVEYDAIEIIRGDEEEENDA